MMSKFALAVYAIFLIAGLSAPATACPGAESPCEFDGGSYYALAPQGWDGENLLPALVYFHGWQRTGRVVVKNDRVTGPVLSEKVLLIAPNGLDKTWAHVGSPSQARDEEAFIDALLADVKARWPIDEDRLWASGFSQGGSMAWDVACYRGRAFAAVFPAAGAFWRPHPETCPAAPVNLWHTHGTSDTVVPMEGRPIGEAYHQGDVEEGVALWVFENGCAAAPDRVEEIGELTCRHWESCESGRSVRLCLHEGGHKTPENWLDLAIGWAKTVAERQGVQQ